MGKKLKAKNETWLVVSYTAKGLLWLRLCCGLVSLSHKAVNGFDRNVHKLYCMYNFILTEYLLLLSVSPKNTNDTNLF